tara:strand:- start:3980 stop:4108 length:129 start_codon:yes stop_codon:yes gene_type:complete
MPCGENDPKTINARVYDGFLDEKHYIEMFCLIYLVINYYYKI